MLKIHKKIIFSFLISFLILLLSVTTAFAFFTNTIEKSFTSNITGNDTSLTNVVEVSNFYELFNYTNGSKYNDSSNVNDVKERMVINLKNDITVLTSFTVSVDCHINLGGNKLFLNNHTITFEHAYHGNVVISNGTIFSNQEGVTSSSGKIVFETPFAYPILDNINVKKYNDKSIVDLTTDDILVKLEIDTDLEKKVLAYNVFTMISEKIVNYISSLPKRLSYDELSSLEVNKTNDVYNYDASLFINKYLNCYFTKNDDEVCSLVYGDLDLPTSYLGYSDISIKYESSNPNVLTSLGDVTLPSSFESVSLKVTLSKNEEPFAETTYLLHVVNPNISDNLRLIASNYSSQYFAPYYDQTTSTYVIKHSLQLPLKINITSDKYITYEYEALDKDLKTNSSAISSLTIKNDKGEETIIDDMKLFEPSEDIKYLRVKINNKDTITYPITASDAGLITTNASLAQNFIRDNYGGSIILTATYGNDNTINGFSSQELYTLYNGNASSKIKQLTYELMNDTNKLYQLTTSISSTSSTTLVYNDTDTSNGYLSVIDISKGNPLDYVQSVQLNCIFTFDDGTTETIQVPITCTSGDQGGNLNEFLPYYNYYDQMFYSQTGCYTIKTFNMPFAYGTNGPVVCYDLAIDVDDETTWNKINGLKISLYYNKGYHTLTIPTGKYSLVDALNNYLTSSNITIEKIIAYGDAKWCFEITTDNVDNTNTDFKIIYNYKMKTNDKNFIIYKDSSNVIKYTDFTLPGILHLGKEVVDENLYSWMYLTFGSEATYTSGSIVLRDWLQQNKPLDVTTSQELTKVSSFKGIEYLIGTSYANFSGKDLSSNYADTLSYISKMISLQKLDLSNCNLSLGTASNPVNDAILELINLNNLYELSLNDNNIYSFAFLTEFSSLETVYVYNNLDENTVDGLFYGSKGLVNSSYFGIMSNNGVLVYNINGVLFTENTGINDYKILSGIEYQKKLPLAMDISSIYSSFSTDPDDYGFFDSYTVGTSSYRASNKSLTFETVSTTMFRGIYSFTVNGVSVKIIVDFEVVRV